MATQDSAVVVKINGKVVGRVDLSERGAIVRLSLTFPEGTKEAGPGIGQKSKAAEVSEETMTYKFRRATPKAPQRRGWGVSPLG
jgi:hypothetical protein